jgi:porin
VATTFQTTWPEAALTRNLLFRMTVCLSVIAFLAPASALASDANKQDANKQQALDELLSKFKTQGTKVPAKESSKDSAKEAAREVVNRDPASSTSSKPAQIQRAKEVSQKAETKELKSEAAPEPSTASAATTAAPTAAEETENPFEDKVFGDWGGLRKSALEKGFELEVIYKSEFTGNFTGGTEKKDFHLHNLDIWTNFDFEKLAGVKGLSLTAYGLGDSGGKPSETFGEIIVSSNIEAPNTFKLYEIYFTQKVDDRLLFMLGTRDLNAEFFATDSSGIFRNSAFGISTSLAQTGVNGPSIFPTTSLAAVGKYVNEDHFYLTVGVFNAQAGDPNDPLGTHLNTKTDEGYMYIWETGYTPKVNEKSMKLSLGAWTYSLPQAALDPEKSSYTNSGFYILADYPITSMTSAFVRLGTASPEINQLANEAQIGLLIENPLPGRENDAFGIGFVQAQASSDYRTINTSLESTSVVELAYDAKIANGIVLSPSYQHILNPGLVADQAAVSIWAARLKLDF